MSQAPTARDWQTLYHQAILESDPARIPGMIDLAYKAIQRRAFELWYRGGAAQTKERLELDSARYFLDLLRNIGTLTKTGARVDNLDKGSPSRNPAD